MTERIIISGAGGQGIMLLGKVLAEAAMREGRFVTWLPAYGAEVRGGTAHCMVVISDKEIGSPFVVTADALIAMNAPSVEKFAKRLKKRGVLVLNSSLSGEITDKNLIIGSYPFTDMAIKLGNIKTANMIALGCLLAYKNLVDKKTIFSAMSDMAGKDKKDLLEINKKALEEGLKVRNG